MTLLFFFLNPLLSVSTALLLLFLLLWLKCVSFKTFQLPPIPPTRKNSQKKQLELMSGQKRFTICTCAEENSNFASQRSCYVYRQPVSISQICMYPWELTCWMLHQAHPARVVSPPPDSSLWYCPALQQAFCMCFAKSGLISTFLLMPASTYFPAKQPTAPRNFRYYTNLDFL